MSTDRLPHPITLHPAWLWPPLAAAIDRLQPLARRIHAWHSRRAEYRRSVQAESDMARLSLRTLQDIGAPEGLIGQRRWQDEHDAVQRSFWLNPRC